MVVSVPSRKKLAVLVREGLVVTRQYLRKHGFENHAIDNLVKSEALNLLAPGVYHRGPRPHSWESIVYSLQQVLNLDLVVGGLTSLQLLGYHQFVPLSKKKMIHLYGKDKLPHWLNLFAPELEFVKHNSNAVFTSVKPGKELLRNWGEYEKQILLSRPERALLEVLLDVPKKITVEHAVNLMEQCTSFSPSSVQELLELSKSVKVKRLFLWLAERQNYAWFKRINLSKIDFGSGKLALVKGGKFNSKYRMTAPEEFE